LAVLPMLEDEAELNQSVEMFIKLLRRKKIMGHDQYIISRTDVQLPERFFRMGHNIFMSRRKQPLLHLEGCGPMKVMRNPNRAAISIRGSASVPAPKRIPTMQKGFGSIRNRGSGSIILISPDTFIPNHPYMVTNGASRQKC
jgi:hypothetical protein